MSRLPNADKAIIEAAKLRDYVLCLGHPLGRPKARFFSKFGFSAENCEVFERCLRELILSTEVTNIEDTKYGQKFVVEGQLVGPSGNTVQVVTVWIILKGVSVPKFITAYPGG